MFANTTPGANTINILRKNIYFYVKRKYFRSLRKNLTFLRKHKFHSIGPRTQYYTAYFGVIYSKSQLSSLYSVRSYAMLSANYSKIRFMYNTWSSKRIDK